MQLGVWESRGITAWLRSSSTLPEENTVPGPCWKQQQQFQRGQPGARLEFVRQDAAKVVVHAHCRGLGLQIDAWPIGSRHACGRARRGAVCGGGSCHDHSVPTSMIVIEREDHGDVVTYMRHAEKSGAVGICLP